MGFESKIERILIFVSILSLFALSCNKDKIEISSNLIGIWNVEYFNVTCDAESIISKKEFDFYLELDSDGTGLYGFPDHDLFANVFWTTSFDMKYVYITIEDDFEEPKVILQSFRFEIIEDSNESQIWHHINIQTDSLITRKYVWELSKE